MVKSDLILALVNEQTFLSAKDVELCINQILESMSNALSRGDRIEVRSFGSFSLHYRPPRNAHNPRTGQRVATVAKYRPYFKPGKLLRTLVNEAFLRELAQQGGKVKSRTSSAAIKETAREEEFAGA